MDGDGRPKRGARSLALQTTMVTMYNVVEQASRPLAPSLRTPKFEIEHRGASQRLEE